MIQTGYITSENKDELIIATRRPAVSIDYLLQTEIEIRFNDGRTISNEQRAKIYCLFKEISQQTGYTLFYDDDPAYIKGYLKTRFCIAKNTPEFSLSNVDMTTANDFLQYIIEWCIFHNIPLSERPIAPEINKYMFMCMIRKKCAVYA